MTDKSVKTAEKPKRNRYVPYSSLPQKGLNVDRPYDQAGEIERPRETITLADVVTLIRVIEQKDYSIESLSKAHAGQQQVINSLFEDVQYLKDQLNNPNLFIRQ